MTPEQEARKDQEIDLVVYSMNRFRSWEPEYLRIQRIWHACSLSGALREGFPEGTEALESAWRDLVTECRRKVQ